MRALLPELPNTKRTRFKDEYKLKPSDARQICEDIDTANFVEHVFSELYAWLESLDAVEDIEAEKAKLAKLVSGWLLSKLGGLLATRSETISTMKVNPENFAELITLIATRKINNTSGLKVLEAMLVDGNDPTHIMEEQQLGQVQDEDALVSIVTGVIENYPAEVARYKAGEEQLIKFLIGMIMKASEGTADPGMAKNILLVELNKD